MLKAWKRFPPTRGPLQMALALMLLVGTAPASWAQTSEPKILGPKRMQVSARDDSDRPRGHGHDTYVGRGCLDYDPLPQLPDVPYEPPVIGYVPVQLEAQGGLDLDVQPKDTEVFLNGDLIGTAGDFDGWPRYLWLEEDVYELIFYKEGYETVLREIAVRPDVVVSVDFRMQPGPSTRPEELIRSRDRDFDDPSGGTRKVYGRGYVDRPSGDRAPDDGFDLVTDAGRLVLQISPPEASIYIDGQFMGIGAMLTEIEDGLLMDEGEHRIEVFHPRFRKVERSFTVTAGEQTQLVIALEEESTSH